MAERMNDKPPIERPFYVGGAEVNVRLRGIPGLTDVNRRRIKAEVVSLDAALSNAGIDDADIDTILDARLDPVNVGVPVRNVVGFADPSIAPGTKRGDVFWADYQNIYAAVSRGRQIPVEDPELWSLKEHFDSKIKEILDAHLRGRENERTAYEHSADVAWKYRKVWKGTAFWPLTDHKYRIEDIFTWMSGKNTGAESRSSMIAYKRGALNRRRTAREAEGALQTERAEDRATARKRLAELRRRNRPAPAGEESEPPAPAQRGPARAAPETPPEAGRATQNQGGLTDAENAELQRRLGVGQSQSALPTQGEGGISEADDRELRRRLGLE